MPVFDDVRDILPVFGMPAVKIIFLGIGRQIDKATLTTLQTGKLLFHNWYLFPQSQYELIHTTVGYSDYHRTRRPYEKILS